MTPAARIASANEAEAIVAPAVVEAVAADISAPAIGAINVPPLLQWANISTNTSLMAEALMIPANVPVPTSKIAIPDIFSNPYERQVAVSRHLRVASMPTTPPTGKAIIGSITIPAIGRSANSRIVTIGPNKLRHNAGNSSLLLASSPFASSPLTLSPFAFSGISGIITNTVITNPMIAGTIPAAITDDRGALKFSAAIMVLGLGERILPHLPPPIIAKSNLRGESCNLLPIMMAIGAMVMTATSMKTPIPVSIIAESAKAR